MARTAFHIHVDAERVTPGFENFVLQRLGFWSQDFLHEDPTERSYEPARHLTQHLQDAREFKAQFAAIRTYLDDDPHALEGYVEGEFVPSDVHIPEKPFDPSIMVPCKVRLTSLPPGPKTFRQDEIHITMNRERSDPRLFQALRQMGLYVAYMPKTDGVVAIFTVQGLLTDIGSLVSPLHRYLETAGGSVHCSIKEERIADWWKSRPDLPLPPVVERIEWS